MAVGFRKNQKNLRIAFRGELAGLEVTFRRASTATMRSIVALAEGATADVTQEQRAARVLDLCDAVGGLIVAWNYEDENGQPLPATAEVLAAEDAAFTIAVAYGWLDGVAELAEQLRGPDQDQMEASLPMEFS